MFTTNFEDLRRRKAFSEKRNLPLSTIVRETGISINALQRVRHGNVKDVRLSTIDRLCQYFAVKSVAELIEFKAGE